MVSELFLIKRGARGRREKWIAKASLIKWKICKNTYKLRRIYQFNYQYTKQNSSKWNWNLDATSERNHQPQQWMNK